jgi:DNA repair protein RecO (recombination protein O)
MTHKTKGIVLRAVKYGETSLVVTVLTELFGLQSYMVKGVRTSAKKGGAKASMFQPASLLEMEVYHNTQKNLQFIKEYKWVVVYEQIFTNVIKNSVAMFMIELLQKAIKQPEENSDLYHFCEDSFLALDNSSGTVTANFSLFFALQLPSLLGFQLTDNYSAQTQILDLREGAYLEQMPDHPYAATPPHSYYVSELLKAQHPEETAALQLNREIRQTLLQYLETYYALHLSDFGKMKTLPVLKEVLG